MAKSLLLVCLIVTSFTPLCFSKDWKWIDTVPYWCTQLGRSLVVKNASAEQCQRFCDEGCEAVEWWEGDGNACHICTDLSLHMFFGITSDTSYPPHVFIKEPVSGESFSPTTAKDAFTTNARGITDVHDERIPTSSMKDIEQGAGINEEEGSSIGPEKATSFAREERILAEPELVATSSAQAEAATSSIQEEVATSSAQEEAATSSAQEEAATSSTQEEVATSSAQKEAATSSAQEQVAASSAQEEAATSSAQEEAATSSTQEEVATSSAQEEAATSSAQEEVATSSAQEEAATSSAQEEVATSSAQEEAATSSTQEEASTSSTQEEVATSSAQEEAATSSAQEEGATTSTQDETATSSAQDEAATSSAQEEAATSSAQEEEPTTSTMEAAVTLAAPEELARTSAVELDATSDPGEATSFTSEVMGTPSLSVPQERATPSAPKEPAISAEPEVTATSSMPEIQPPPPEPEITAASSMPEIQSSLPEPEVTATSSVEEVATTLPTLRYVPTSAPEKSIRPGNLPSPPRNISIRSISETQLQVYWVTSLQPYGEISSYTINITDAIGGLIKTVQVPGNVHTFLVDSLEPISEYGFAISAVNQRGQGAWSAPVYAETKLVVGKTEATDNLEAKSDEKQEPFLDLSHTSDFMVAGMDKSTRAICFVRGQEFLGWFKSTGEKITGKDSKDRIYIEDEDDSHSLVIQRLKLTDGGIYTCQGSTTEVSYTLYVEFSIVDPPAKQILQAGKEGFINVGVMIGYPAPEYLWRKNGLKFNPNIDRFSLQPDGSIKINKVLPMDDGRYSVRISQLNRRRETTKRIEVVVIDPPQFTETPEPRVTNLTKGYPASFECSATGIPPPIITWTGPDGKPIDESDSRMSVESDGSLKLAVVELEDVGTWTCEAKSSVGQISVQAEVQAIYTPPEIQPVNDITVDEGDSAVLNCSASGFPVPNVVWIKNDREYPGQMRSPGFSSITFSNLGLQDISLFTCEASNAATNEQGEVVVISADVYVYVMVEPKPYHDELTKGPVYSTLGNPVPVTFACAFTGYPPPKVWISKDGREVATGFESLAYDIATQSLDDYGVYYCSAENVVNRSSSNYSLDIRRPDRPKFTLKPLLPTRNPTKGYPVSLTWAVSGKPKPEVRWRSAEGSYLSSNDPRFSLTEGNLNIEALQEIDEGIWTLEATNMLGTEKASVLFEIIYVAPQIVPISDVVLKEGDSTRLECNATGVPAPDVVWIKEGKEFAGQEKFPGGSVINLSDLGLEDNSQLTCEARNGAQDGEGNELYDSASITLVVQVEPRPVSEVVSAPPIVSYIGNPKPTVMNCAFSGFPIPEVKLVKDDIVLVNGTESVSYSVTVNRMEDFGVYVCTAENEVKPSSMNYTFEIKAADPPSKPRDISVQATCDNIILSWAPPKNDGGLPVMEYVITMGDQSVTVSSESNRHVLENLNHSTTYVIEVTANTEAAIGKPAVMEVKTSQFCKILSCVNIDHVGDEYTLNASQGVWPNKGFCRVLSAQNAPDTKTYMISVDFYVPKVTKANAANFLGVLFNAEDQNNFEFIYFRIGEITGPCFQTGEIQNGRFNWYGSQTGSCAPGSPRRGRWLHITVEIRNSDVSIFLDGVFITTFKGHFPPKGFGGMLVANHEGNVVRFKDFMLSEISSMPFQTKSCASAKENAEFFSLISQPDLRPRDFCRAFYDQSDAVESSSYQVSVDLYSEADWSGDNTAFLGIIFNARDINNADFIYFRPYWKDHCYQTGYLMGGRQLREGARTGPCSCTVQGEKWFNVRLEIRGNAVIVFMDNIPATVFKSHFPASSKGSGVLITGGCRASIRFRNFTLSSLPPLPFETKNCKSARLGGDGDYYKLMTYSGLKDSTQPGICRAFYPKVIAGNSYVIRVKFYTKGSLLGGKYGVIFNVKNADNFEFVYFRPYQRDKCAQAGYLRGTKVREFEPKSLSCAYGFMRSGSWYDVRVKVSDSEVKVYIDDVEVSVFRGQSTANGQGGIMVANGFKGKIKFKEYQISQ